MELTSGAPGLFEPENPLEQAMLEALLDRSRMPAFEAALSSHELLIPLEDNAEVDHSASGVVRHGEQRLLFRRVQFESHVGVAAYTSLTQLTHAIPTGARYAVLTGHQLATGWDEQTPMLLNAGGSLGLPIPASKVRRLATRPGG